MHSNFNASVSLFVATDVDGTLFLGDLSTFTDEKVLHDAFCKYGDIEEIRIKRSPDSSRKPLCYGFLKFYSIHCAVQAMQEMDGCILQGRALRIRWATNKRSPQNHATITNNNRPTARQVKSRAQVLVSFLSTTSALVIEESLRSNFSSYGTIVDCTIKKSTMDAHGRHSGYGFVDFEDNENGIRSALRMIDIVHDMQIGEAIFDCRMSESLRRHLNEMEHIARNAQAQSRRSNIVQEPPPGLHHITHHSDPVHGPPRSYTGSQPPRFLPVESLPHREHRQVPDGGYVTPVSALVAGNLQTISNHSSQEGFGPLGSSTPQSSPGEDLRAIALQVSQHRMPDDTTSGHTSSLPYYHQSGSIERVGSRLNDYVARSALSIPSEEKGTMDGEIPSEHMRQNYHLTALGSSSWSSLTVKAPSEDDCMRSDRKSSDNNDDDNK